MTITIIGATFAHLNNSIELGIKTYCCLGGTVELTVANKCTMCYDLMK